MLATLRSVSTPGPAPLRCEAQERPKRTRTTCLLTSLDTLTCHLRSKRGKLNVLNVLNVLKFFKSAPPAIPDAASTGWRVSPPSLSPPSLSSLYALTARSR